MRYNVVGHKDGKEYNIAFGLDHAVGWFIDIEKVYEVGDTVRIPINHPEHGIVDDIDVVIVLKKLAHYVVQLPDYSVSKVMHRPAANHALLYADEFYNPKAIHQDGLYDALILGDVEEYLAEYNVDFSFDLI